MLGEGIVDIGVVEGVGVEVEVGELTKS